MSPSSPGRGNANKRGRSAPARGRRPDPVEDEDDEDDDEDEDDEDEEDDDGLPGRTAIHLAHMRYRHLAWSGFGLISGTLLLLKLGTVGQWLGVVLLIVGAVAAYAFVRTLLFPAGTIVVGDEQVELPRGLCKGAPAVFKTGEIRHVYLLRRAVPWTRAAPVLVVEAGGRFFSYPRDWFDSEADQRRVVRDLHRRGVGRATVAEPAVAAEPAVDAAEST